MPDLRRRIEWTRHIRGTLQMVRKDIEGGRQEVTKSKIKEILNNISSDEIDPEDKLLAIEEVTEMETYNSITKRQMVDALDWLINEYI